MRSSIFLNVTPCIVTEVSGQPLSPIIEGQAVQVEACFIY